MAPDERDAGGYTPGQIRALKIAIAIMTVAIVAGLAILVLTIAYRAANYKRLAATAPIAAADAGVPMPEAGKLIEGRLPAGSHVVAVSAWGDKLVLVVEEAGDTSLLVLDPRTAKIAPLARLSR